MFPINPLDLTMPFTDANNELICLSTFFWSNSTSQDVDVILGDAFLRNVYTLFNYGNWTTPGTSLPYVQLLSVSPSSISLPDPL